MFQLSKGSLGAIMSGENIVNPVVQILGHKKLASKFGGERYQLQLSDGLRMTSYSTLATQLNCLIDTDLTNFTICQITHYFMSTVGNSGTGEPIMVILDIMVKVPGYQVRRKIGNPTQLDPIVPETAPAASVVPENKQPQSPCKPGNTAMQNKNLEISMSSASPIATLPIAALSPYENRWVIKARVMTKSPVRKWSNSYRGGTLFSMDLHDESGDIRCTAFNNECDKFYDMIEIGRAYYISRCIVKVATRQFTTLKNDCEMTMTRNSSVVACHDDDNGIPTPSFNFQPLSAVESSDNNTKLDILAIVKSYDDVQPVFAKASGQTLIKREIQIVDSSGVQVTLTLWETQADEFNAADNAVIAIKGARVNEFNGGKSVKISGSSFIKLEPDIPEAHRLRAWWNSKGKVQDCKIVARSGGSGGIDGPIMSLEEGGNKCLALIDGVENYTVKAAVGMIRRDNAIYQSCPTQGCNKKIVNQSDGFYKCEKCNRAFPNFKYQCVLNMSISDWTGSQWVTAFNEVAEKILGHTAQQLGEIRETDADAYEAIFAKASFYTDFFKIKANKETYNDETRIKATVTGVGLASRKIYHKHLLQELQ